MVNYNPDLEERSRIDKHRSNHGFFRLAAVRHFGGCGLPGLCQVKFSRLLFAVKACFRWKHYAPLPLRSTASSNGVGSTLTLMDVSTLAGGNAWPHQNLYLSGFIQRLLSLRNLS